MRYHLGEIPALLRTPVGRSQIRRGLWYRIWPLLLRLAIWHRQTLARRTRVVAVVGRFGKSTTKRSVATALGVSQLPATEGRVEPVALAQIPARRRMLALGEVNEPVGSPGAVYREIGARLAGIGLLRGGDRFPQEFPKLHSGRHARRPGALGPAGG